MAPRNNPEVYTQMLSSILAPHTYMNGLIAGAADRQEDSYTIPQGLSPQQCMLAVLGGILSDDNISNMATSSSANTIRANDWKKIWFIRDYAGLDEHRSRNMMDTISKGRQKAIKAFNAYNNGDPSALNELIKGGAQSIKLAQEHTYQILGENWEHTHAATKLLVSVANQPLPEGITGIPSDARMNSDLMLVWDEFLTKENEIEDKLKALPQDAINERRDLLLEKYTYNRIKADCNKEIMKALNDTDGLVPVEVSNTLNYRSLSKTSEYITLNNHYYDLYKQTHPSKLLHALSGSDTRKVLFDQYKKQIEASEEFEKEAASENPRSALDRIKLDVSIPDFLSPAERSELEQQWIDQTQNVGKEYSEISEQYEKRNENLEKKLGEIAKSFSLLNYKVFMADSIKAAKYDLADLIDSQNNLYLYDDRHGLIVEVHSDNGKDYTARPVSEFGEDSPSAQSMKNTVYCNGIMRALKVNNKFLAGFNKSYKAGSGSLVRLQDSSPQHAEFCQDLFELQDLCEQSLGGMTDEIHGRIKDKLAVVNEKIKALSLIKVSGVGNIMYTAKLFSYSLSEELKNADKLFEEKLSRFSPGESVPYEDRLNLSQQRVDEIKKQQEISSLIKQHPAGSRQTDVQLNMAVLLNRFEQELKADPQLNESCAEYVSSLYRLSEITNKLYERDDEGHFKAMSRDDFKELISAYNASLAAAGKADLQSSDNSSLSMIGYHIRNMLKNDMSSLMNIQPGAGASLPEAIDQGRTRRVDVSGKELSHVGEKSNTRYALSMEENGKTIKGFFTNEKIYKTGEALRSEVEKAFKTFKESHPEVAFLIDHMVNDMIFNKVYDYGLLVENAVEFSKTTSAAKKNAELNGCSIDTIVSRYKKVLSECEYLVDLPDVPTFLLQYDSQLNADEGSSISGRNVAMSKVANLFGIPEIIAQSVPMELYDNGKINKGIFMANAKGHGIDSIMPEDVVNTTPESNNTPGLITDIANLQILDYVCGNADRHSKNMFYIFNEDKSKVIGIQGIDNDLSFGTIKRPSDEMGDAAVDIPIDNIEIITKELADNLLSLNDLAFKDSLADTGLGSREIDAALDRLHNVQNYIRLQKIKVVDTEEISKFDIKDLAKEGTLFSIAYNATDDLQKTAAKNLEDKKKDREKEKAQEEQRRLEGLTPEEKKPFRFEKTELMNGINVASLTSDIREFKKISTQITESQKKIFGKGSDQFRRLQNAVENYYKKTKNISGNPDERELMQFRANLEAVYECAQDYIKLKKSRDGLGEKTKERFDIATEISAYAKNRLKEFTKAAARKDEIRVEDMNAELKARAALLSKASKNLNQMKTLMTEILKTNTRGEEFNKLMKYGLEAVDKCYDTFTGKSKENLISSRDTKYAETLVLCGTLLSSISKNDPKVARFENGLNQVGADGYIDMIHNDPKMNRFKENSDMMTLVKFCANDINYLDLDTGELKADPGKKTLDDQLKQPQFGL